MPTTTENLTERPEDTIRRLAQENLKLRAQLGETLGDLDALHDQIAGNYPRATFWLQIKVTRQRRELERRSLRAYARRLVLRAYAEAGHTLTDEQWAEIRQKVADARMLGNLARVLPTAASVTDDSED